jgi:hypothetical protein
MSRGKRGVFAKGRAEVEHSHGKWRHLPKTHPAGSISQPTRRRDGEMAQDGDRPFESEELHATPQELTLSISSY